MTEDRPVFSVKEGGRCLFCGDVWESDVIQVEKYGQYQYSVCQGCAGEIWRLYFNIVQYHE